MSDHEPAGSAPVLALRRALCRDVPRLGGGAARSSLAFAPLSASLVRISSAAIRFTLLNFVSASSSRSSSATRAVQCSTSVVDMAVR
jgi:hypothetical protein